MSEEINIHASCVALRDRGVLLLGASGSGKSDLALRLIDGGARLVADDRTLLFVKNGALHAKAPASIKGLLEIRGLGIVKQPVRASVKIALVVMLGREGARLPRAQFYRPPPALKVNTKLPQIALDAFFASTPAKTRAALAAFSRGLFRDSFNLKSGGGNPK
jgi:HPr kinase/phosphorylase